MLNEIQGGNDKVEIHSKKLEVDDCECDLLLKIKKGLDKYLTMVNIKKVEKNYLLNWLKSFKIGIGK